MTGPPGGSAVDAQTLVVRTPEQMHELGRRLAASLRAGDVVLLSPACASYDQFENFEERGARFRAIVEAL